jgi:hypothetical protein
MKSSMIVREIESLASSREQSHVLWLKVSIAIVSSPIQSVRESERSLVQLYCEISSRKLVEVMTDLVVR